MLLTSRFATRRLTGPKTMFSRKCAASETCRFGRQRFGARGATSTCRLLALDRVIGLRAPKLLLQERKALAQLQASQEAYAARLAKAGM